MRENHSISARRLVGTLPPLPLRPLRRRAA
jgi:hypothetical protein